MADGTGQMTYYDRKREGTMGWHVCQSVPIHANPCQSVPIHTNPCQCMGTHCPWVATWWHGYPAIRLQFLTTHWPRMAMLQCNIYCLQQLHCPCVATRAHAWSLVATNGRPLTPCYQIAAWFDLHSKWGRWRYDGARLECNWWKSWLWNTLVSRSWPIDNR